MNKLILPLVILIAAIIRLLPHPPNFTPIIAIGLFSGYCFNNKSFAILLPILAMLISDLFIGSHLTIYWVYGSLIIITLLARIFIKKINLKNWFTSSITASGIFFFITNFGVWISSTYYPKTAEGLLICYTMALPFFTNTLLSSLFYTGLLFVTHKLLQSFSPKTISNSI